MNPLYPAAVTCLTLLLYAATVINCGRNRARHQIAAPAITGHMEFEKAYRVQMNTLEGMALFLPSMWLFAAYMSEPWAAVIGLVWVLARSHYAYAYQRNPAKRMPGVIVGFAAAISLFIGGAVGVAMDLAAAI